MGIEGVPIRGGWMLAFRPLILPSNRDRAEVRSPSWAVEARPASARPARFFIDSAHDLPDEVLESWSMCLTNPSRPPLIQSFVWD